MDIMLTHKIRLMPNEKQEEYLRQCAGVRRFAYNWCRDIQKKDYAAYCEAKAAGKTKDKYRFDLSKLGPALNEIKGTEFPWMLEVTKFAAQYGVNDFRDAYERYGKRLAKLPRAKKKGKCREGFYVDNTKPRVTGTASRKRSGRFIVPGSYKSKTVKSKQQRSIKMAEVFDPRNKKIQGYRVVRDTDGWFICINFKLLVPPKIPFKSQEGIGLDLGIKSLAIDSEGGVIASLKAYKNGERKLAKLQKVLSRKTKWVSKGVLSKGYLKAKDAVDRQHAKVRNQRKDALHKASSSLTKNRPFIVLENLHIKGMVKNKKLSKSIMDQGWGMFTHMLTYKGKLYGCEIHKADQYYPSSQLCSCCGHRNKEVKNLAIRDWTCSTCGAEHDRDVNAAKNLRLLYEKLSGESSPLVRCSRI